MSVAKVWIPATRAVITGAGSGIGRAVAHALAAKGAVVACVDLDGEAAKRVADECGHGATGHQADVRDREQLADLGLDDAGIVMANAGVGVSGRFTDMTAEDWNWIRSINLDGVVNTAAVWGPKLLEQGRGHLVITSSGLGFTPAVDLAAYCATKAAVLSLAASLRADWGQHGVGVTAVCPGVINTPIIEAARFVGEAGEHKEEARKLFGKGHSPNTVAKAVVRAIEHDRGIALAGWESKLAYGVHRFAPFAVQQKLAARGLS
ncbi:MAG: putative oxidoreductase EphD [Actinomycetia bacterium]|nr:putative oxidoreductase EphD [Actinomycetes bacterium]